MATSSEGVGEGGGAQQKGSPEGGLLGALLERAPHVFQCELLPQLRGVDPAGLGMLAQCSRGLREAVIASGLPRPALHLVEDYVATVERLSWARRNGCPWVAATAAEVAKCGELEVLKFARAHDLPWDAETLYMAAVHGHRETCWRWAKDQGCPLPPLDASGMLADFYTNNLDWGVDNSVAVGLRGDVYLWSGDTGYSERLRDASHDHDHHDPGANHAASISSGGGEEMEEDEVSEHDYTTSVEEEEVTQSSQGTVAMTVAMGEGYKEAQRYITSVRFNGDGTRLAVGATAVGGLVQIWDVNRLALVRVLTGHTKGVYAMSWDGVDTLATGGCDKKIIIHDVRVPDRRAAVLGSHFGTVCGLKWAPSGNQLASGGNDELVHIWDHRVIDTSNDNDGGAHLHRFSAHRAGVKALAWCPFKSHLLASGGGTGDKCIHFWNTDTGDMLDSINTHGQVCALEWNRREREILSSHGYPYGQRSTMCLWRYPSLKKICDLQGHHVGSRVLHMAQSPDGRTVVSGATDQTLRFWNWSACDGAHEGGGCVGENVVDENS